VRHRVPELCDEEFACLAEVGALNSTYYSTQKAHRRTALWDGAHAVQDPGPLFSNPEMGDSDTPLERMTHEEGLVADYHGTSLTLSPHPLFYSRSELDRMGVRTASQLKLVANQARVSITGCVIARQRPGTASGLLFLSLEDETKISNVVIMPDLFERHRLPITRERFLLVEGKMQNIDGL
jgi:error-prone DNA polymerase